ncbi:Acyl transferase/acyl hydrolase/lysophospholipase [Sesbania bispinosa]|nr:Acyl transferase/acyl hydrolase/lysophospholipase [Sesbania bispinosa]
MWRTTTSRCGRCAPKEAALQEVYKLWNQKQRRLLSRSRPTTLKSKRSFRGWIAVAMGTKFLHTFQSIGARSNPMRRDSYGGRRMGRKDEEKNEGICRKRLRSVDGKLMRSLVRSLLWCQRIQETQFSRADALETDSFDFRLWEVCRATSVEPGLLEPVQMRSVDGQTKCVAVDSGFVRSNPGRSHHARSA